MLDERPFTIPSWQNVAILFNLSLTCNDFLCSRLSRAAKEATNPQALITAFKSWLTKIGQFTTMLTVPTTKVSKEVEWRLWTTFYSQLGSPATSFITVSSMFFALSNAASWTKSNSPVRWARSSSMLVDHYSELVGVDNAHFEALRTNSLRVGKRTSLWPSILLEMIVPGRPSHIVGNSTYPSSHVGQKKLSINFRNSRY